MILHFKFHFLKYDSNFICICIILTSHQHKDFSIHLIGTNDSADAKPNIGFIGLLC